MDNITVFGAKTMADMRHEGDVAVNTPVWFTRLALRIAQLEAGRVYNLTLIVPAKGEPTWSVTGGGKLENQR